MKRRKGALCALVAPAFAAAVIGLVPAVGLAEKAFPSHQNAEGMVTVTVTPLALTGDTWRFNVQLETHVTPLNQDLASASTLSDGKGREERAVAWQGDPPGGHHRKGVLVFKPIVPASSTITLTIRGVGSVPERAFTWSVPGR